MSKHRRWVTYPAMILIGLGVGWFVGLSVSPVVSIVITTVLGSAAAIVTALSGLETKQTGAIPPDQSRSLTSFPLIDPWPLGILVVGMVIAGSFGVWARTHNWLGVGTPVANEAVEWDRIKRAVDEWAALTGKPREEIAMALFTDDYTLEMSSKPLAEDLKGNVGILFGKGSTACLDVLGKSGDGLLNALRSSTKAEFRNLYQMVVDEKMDVADVPQLLEKVLCTDSICTSQ